MDLKMCQINFKVFLFITLVIVFISKVDCRTWPYASAQLIEPKWNWEEVILSRNGPSTTTPKPTTTEYTTLRNVIGKNNKPVRALGSSGSVESAPLVPRYERGRADPLTISPNSANLNQLHVSTGLLASCIMLLTICINPFQIHH